MAHMTAKMLSITLVMDIMPETTMRAIISILMELERFLVQEELAITTDMCQSILELAIIIQRLAIIQLPMQVILVFPTSEMHWDTAVPLITMLDITRILQVVTLTLRVARHTPQVVQVQPPIAQIR
jgi:hypothetical protein